MGGFFGVASREDCTLELFYGVDYHSHLVQDEEEWRPMEQMVSAVQSTI